MRWKAACNKHYETVQVNEDGELLQPGSSQFSWTPIGGPCIQLVYGKGGSVGTIDIKSEIMTPLQSREPLLKLLTSMQATLKHNFIPGNISFSQALRSMICLFSGIFSLASCVMAMQYETIIEIYRACPIPLLYGDIETGTQAVHYIRTCTICMSIRKK